MKSLWTRLQDVVVHRILHLDDTPHRIAWGVALGAIVAFTPTLGLQIAIYLLAATVLRANQVSGVPILFISNPVTAVPLYYFVWTIGSLILHGDEADGGVSEATIAEKLRAATAGAEPTLQRLVDWEFWRGIGKVLADLGDELWVGAFACGLFTAVPAYIVTLWGVRTFRSAREALRISRIPDPPST